MKFAVGKASGKVSAEKGKTKLMLAKTKLGKIALSTHLQRQRYAVVVVLSAGGDRVKWVKGTNKSQTESPCTAYLLLCARVWILGLFAFIDWRKTNFVSWIRAATFESLIFIILIYQRFQFLKKKKIWNYFLHERYTKSLKTHKSIKKSLISELKYNSEAKFDNSEKFEIIISNRNAKKISNVFKKNNPNP